MTETEINAGILSAEKVDTGTFWFFRKFVDMEEQVKKIQPDTPEEKTLKKFYGMIIKENQIKTSQGYNHKHITCSITW